MITFAKSLRYFTALTPATRRAARKVLLLLGLSLLSLGLSLGLPAGIVLMFTQLDSGLTPDFLLASSSGIAICLFLGHCARRWRMAVQCAWAAELQTSLYANATRMEARQKRSAAAISKRNARTLTRSANNVADFVASPVATGLCDCCVSVTVLAVLFAFEPAVLWPVFVFLCLLLALRSATNPGHATAMKKSAAAREALDRANKDILAEAPYRRLYGGEAPWDARHAQKLLDVTSTDLAVIKRTERLDHLTGLLVWLTGLVVVVLAVFAYWEGQIGFAFLIGINFLIWRLALPLQTIVTSQQRLLQLRQALSTYLALARDLEKSEEVIDPHVDGAGPADIAITQVGLRTPQQRALLIGGFSTQIKQGSSVALSGPTNAGKTALLKFLGGISVPDFGRITLAGRVLEQIPSSVLRARLCCAALDEPPPAPLSIRAFLTNDQALSDSALWGALEHSGAATAVSAQPFGLDDMVSKVSNRLSDDGAGIHTGMLVARLHMARCYLSGAQVFLIDACPPQLETSVDGKAFYEWVLGLPATNRTVIFVTRRRDLIRRADGHIALCPQMPPRVVFQSDAHCLSHEKGKSPASPIRALNQKKAVA